MAERYENFANYETWAVNLYMNNDEAVARDWLAEAKEAVAEAKPEYSRVDPTRVMFTARDNAVFALADTMKEAFGEQCDAAYETLGGAEGIMGWLLTAAVGNIEWREIAKEWVGKVTD
jgi:hypothetical protein